MNGGAPERDGENPRERRAALRGAFSLIELIAVLVIMAVIGGAALPAMSNLSASRAAAAASRLVRDLGYARERAIATGTTCWVVFSAAGETYSILDEDPTNPGRADAVTITDPATGEPFTVTLGAGDSAGVGIVSAVFDGAEEVGFDWVGTTLNSDEEGLAANGTVTLTGGRTVTVLKDSGLASFP